MPIALLATLLLALVEMPMREAAMTTLQLTSERTMKRDDGMGNSSSHDQDTIIARVRSRQAEGVEIEFDLPATATAQDRASTWQFPLRIIRPATGDDRLADRDAVQARISKWLVAAKLTRSACGHMIFTWNAFRIECNPEAALRTVAAFDFALPIVREGMMYRDLDAATPAPLKRMAGKSPTTYVTTLTLDPERVRNILAETDVAAAEIMGKPLTYDNAKVGHANDVISGKIVVTFETDDEGRPLRRTRVVTSRIEHAQVGESIVTTQALTRAGPPLR